jgi:hypothetical protein
MIRVFIAGPYDDNASEETRQARVYAAMDVWHELQERGFWAYCPHLSHYLHLRRNKPREHWLAHSLEALRQCHCVYRMPGESPGAVLEVEYAQSHHKPVFTSLAEVSRAYGVGIW